MRYNKIMNNLIVKVFLLCVFFFAATTCVHAQESFPGSLSISSSPEYPRPGEPVTLEVRASRFDIDRAEIRWIVNGETRQQGVGNDTFTLQAPQKGSEQVVSVTVTTPDDRVGTTRITIKPQSVDIIWEAKTYTPPWYKGKALYTNDSTITFTAMPEITTASGNTVSTSELFYQWERNGTTLSERGVGKQSVSIPVIRGYNNIGVTVETLDGKYKAYKEITVNESKPKLLLYESDSLYGLLFEKALQTQFTFDTNESSFTVIPYFFSATTMNSGFINYAWELNNEPIDTFGNRETFRNESGTSGSAHVHISAKHTSSLLQEDDVELMLSF